MQNVSTSSPLIKLVLQNNPNSAVRQNQLTASYNNGTAKALNNNQAIDSHALTPLKQNSATVINPIFMISSFGALLLAFASISNVGKSTKYINELTGQVEKLLQKTQENIANNLNSEELKKIQKALSALSSELQNSKTAHSNELGKLQNLMNELQQAIQKSQQTKMSLNIDAQLSQITKTVSTSLKFAQDEMSDQAVFLSDKLMSILRQIETETNKLSQTATSNIASRTYLYQEAAQTIEEASRLITQTGTRTQNKLEQTSIEAIEKLNTALEAQLSKFEAKVHSLDIATQKITSAQSSYSEQIDKLIQEKNAITEMLQKLGKIKIELQANVDKLGEYSPKEAIQSIHEYSKRAIEELSQNAALKNSENYQRLLEQINDISSSAINAITATSDKTTQDSKAIIQTELNKGISQIQEIIQNAATAASQTSATAKSGSKTESVLQTLPKKSGQPHVPTKITRQKTVYQIPQTTTKNTVLSSQQAPQAAPAAATVETQSADEKTKEIQGLIDMLNGSIGNSPTLKGQTLVMSPLEKNNLSSIYFSKNAQGLQTFAYDKTTNEKFSGTIVDTLKSGKQISLTFKDGLIQESVIGDEKANNFTKKVYTRTSPNKGNIQERLEVKISDSSPIVKILNSTTMKQPEEKLPSRIINTILKEASKIKEIMKVTKNGDNLTLFDAFSIPEKTRIVRKKGEKINETIKDGIKTIHKKTQNGNDFFALDTKI